MLRSGDSGGGNEVGMSGPGRGEAGSGLSTTGSGQGQRGASLPWDALPAPALGPPLAVPQRRPGLSRELSLHPVWAHFSSSCKQGIS